MRRKIFLMELFLLALIITRRFTTDIPLSVFALLVTILIVLKYLREGFRLSILGILLSLAILLYGQLNESKVATYLCGILAGVTYFFTPLAYQFDLSPKLVGFNHYQLKDGLDYYEFKPVDETEKYVLRNIKWHFHREIAKMMEYIGLTNSLIVKTAKLLMSYIDKYQLTICEGKDKQTNKTIVFSHDRGATPFIYSQILLTWAEKGYKVATVQHTQASKTGLKIKAEMKVFRQKEVIVRAKQLIAAIEEADNEKIILSGHSYGCATAIEAYHRLPAKMQQKISHIILLDPWLFPLTEQNFNKTIGCPILILANQDFVTFQDMYKRNIKFLAQHKNSHYIVWKNAVHLHQTDLGYVVGNLLGIIAKHQLAGQMLQNNLLAIDTFLAGESIQAKLGAFILANYWKPAKFHTESFNY